MIRRVLDSPPLNPASKDQRVAEELVATLAGRSNSKDYILRAERRFLARSREEIDNL